MDLPFFEDMYTHWEKRKSWYRSLAEEINSSLSKIQEMTAKLEESSVQMQKLLEGVSSDATRFRTAFRDDAKFLEWREENEESFRHAHWLATSSYVHLQNAFRSLTPSLPVIASVNRGNLELAKRLQTASQVLDENKDAPLGDKDQCIGKKIKWARYLEGIATQLGHDQGKVEKHPVDLVTMTCRKSAFHEKCSCNVDGHCVIQDYEHPDKMYTCVLPV
jgi:NAD-specific glutamate dehydrogenase